MSIEMDVGAGVPGAGFGATDVEADIAATKSHWDEDALMVVAATTGVLAVSLLAVCVYLS